ncbi:MAG TPA: LysR family transcriptional regulator [Kofleriaceae bacterium]
MQISDNELPSLEVLRCFALLHRERHLSRAAAKAGLSQPAMSRMLARLRETFGDPLFVRTPSGMLPTARADALAPRIAEIVAATTALVRPEAFDPAQLHRTFTIVTAGFAEAQLLPMLVAELATEAPHVTLSLRAMTGRTSGGEQLQHGADVLLTVREGLPRDAKRVRIHEEAFACALRAKHPTKKLTLDRYCELAHVMVSPGDTGGGVPERAGIAGPRSAADWRRGGPVDNALAQLGRARHVLVRVHTFALAPPIVAATDLVLTAPLLSLRELPGLAIHACPVELPSFAVYLAWHPRVDSDPASAWFRAKVLSAMRRRASSSASARPPRASRA